jgi:hypothetical protein
MLDPEIVPFDDIEAKARELAGHERRIVCGVPRGVTSTVLGGPQ